MSASLYFRSAIVVLSLIVSAPAWAGSITIGAPATSNNHFPFGGRVSDAYTGTRYQQAYASSDFTGIGGPILINAIDFLNGVGTFADSTYTFYFSTITAGIDALSNTNFDSNRGANNTQFASVTLSGAAPSTLTVTGTAFYYDPSQGNLLLDIVVSPGGITYSGGSVYYSARNDATGIFSRYHDFGTANSGYGLVTEFDYALGGVPEPASFALLGGGCLVLLAARRYRRA